MKDVERGLIGRRGGIYGGARPRWLPARNSRCSALASGCLGSRLYAYDLHEHRKGGLGAPRGAHCCRSQTAGKVAQQAAVGSSAASAGPRYCSAQQTATPGSR